MNHQVQRYWAIICFTLVEIMCFSCNGCQGASTTGKSMVITSEPLVRVLLSHASDDRPAVLATTGTYKILDTAHRPVAQGDRLAPSRVTATAEKITLGDRQFSGGSLWLCPTGDSKVVVNSITYYGNLHLLVNGTGKANGVNVVNMVPMENYIACVLSGEMPLSWPDEALQAQAIIARSYALYEKIRNSERNFDVYDTVQSQVYPGIAVVNAHVNAIVTATTGIVLFYRDQPFKTFFHSTCGGYTANAAQVFGHTDITPLSGRPCPFCKESKYCDWQYEADVGTLNLLVQDLKLIPPFVGLAIAQKDKYGRVLTIEVHFAGNRNKIVEAQQIRLLLGAEKLRSTLFEMEATPNSIIFHGKGWGHGVGLCQNGAAKMASEGFSALQIVEFYYPGAAAYRLWK